MKQLLYLVMFFSCSNLFSLPDWGFTVETCREGKVYRMSEEYREHKKISGRSQSVVEFLEPGFIACITCSESEQNNEVMVYSIDIDLLNCSTDPKIIAKGTVVAPVGKDATLTFSNEHGEFTITFSSKI